MKILHLCLSCFYIDNYAYQENIIPIINKEDGHDVKIVSSTETYIDNTKLGYIEPAEYVSKEEIPIVRIPYKHIVCKSLTHKLRMYKGLYKEISVYSPDVILIHGLEFWSIQDVIKYKRNNPHVKLYADTHTAGYNSGLNWLSLNILHRIYYRVLIQKALPYLEKFFYIGESERVFNKENYLVPEEIMEYYPLGGTLFKDADYVNFREKRRKELGVSSFQHLYIHSGKLGPGKRTEDLLRAFISVKDENARLVIIGSIPEDRRAMLERLIDSDDRIIYLGWKKSDELLEYLCAADLYCQPGSVSATMQNAICCNCAIMAYPHLPYTTHLDWGNILWVKTREDMENVFKSISENPEQLYTLKENSHKCAIELLDYRRLAARLYM